tara:strand:+ start:573 stop:905 length:333 start_codon:yes stop_codon:yes gene_type:complete
MRRVVIESPYRGNVQRNLRYLRRCLRDAILRNESPIASHGLLTQEGVLDDNDHRERAAGIAAGLAWHAVADSVVFYTDHGWSPGMLKALAYCQQQNWPHTDRQIGKNGSS